MRDTIFAFLVLSGSLFATTALAAPAALKCTGPDLGPHYFYLWVDYDAGTAIIGKADTTTPASAAIKASISQGEVAWDAPSNGGDMYHYTLNRNSGALAVTAENYESGDVTCNPAAP
jgi:hypothetical protein